MRYISVTLETSQPLRSSLNLEASSKSWLMLVTCDTSHSAMRPHLASAVGLLKFADSALNSFTACLMLSLVIGGRVPWRRAAGARAVDSAAFGRSSLTTDVGLAVGCASEMRLLDEGDADAGRGWSGAACCRTALSRLALSLSPVTCRTCA